MQLIGRIISSIHLHCQTNNVLAAVQDSVRLARIKSDVPTLAYFLLELSGPGNVRTELEAEFPLLMAAQGSIVLDRALERYFKARKISAAEATAMGLSNDAIFAFASNQIESQLGQLRIALIEAKQKSDSVLLSQADQSTWINAVISLQNKISSIERCKSNILNSCFNYSSQVETAEYAAESFARELVNVTDTVTVFLRDNFPGTEGKLGSILQDISSGSTERRSHLFTSTRRLIDSLSENLNLPQDQAGLDKGKTLNRLQFSLRKPSILETLI